jgi:RND family efflux transporter MFP subunit
MEKSKKTLIEKIKSHKAVSATVLVIIIVIAAIIAFRGGNGRQYVTVDRGEIVQEVSVTGKVKALKDVSLSFEKAGRITSASFDIGDKVIAGQVLATIDQSEARADLLKAQAVLQAEQVALQKLKQTAPNDYNDARADLIATTQDAYRKTDDAIRNNVDQFFRNPRSSNTFIEFAFTDGGTVYNFPLNIDLKIRINNERYALELSLIDWQESLRSIDEADNLNSYVLETESVLKQTINFLNNLSLAANSITSPSFDYDATINGYKTTIANARISVASALSLFITAKQALNNAPQLVSGGQGQFDDVLTQEAKVAQSQAAIKAAEVALLKTELRSPIDGVLSIQDARVGEIAQVNTPLINIISDNQFEIEADVSEINVGKLSVGNQVGLTFDAFAGETFAGQVLYIEPSETIVEGVVNYKTKVKIPDGITGLKNGLTANLKIKSAEVSNTIRIPQYALEKRGDVYIARISSDDGVEERIITTGLIGSNGFVEVVSGLNGGEKVLISSE